MTTRLDLLPDVYLTAVQTSRFKTACFSLSFLRPLRQEEAGMNALLPSVLLRGSESAPSIRAIADRLDALCGASVGSLVRKKGEIQLTGLFADGLEDRYAGEPVFSRLLELTAELLLRPRTQGGTFVPQIVMQERQKLLDTIESTLDDKAEYCQTQLLRQMCRGEAYAVGRLGEAGPLAAVDEAALWAHYQKVLASSRAELFYLGSKPAQEVAALLRPLLKDLPRGSCVPVSTAPGRSPKRCAGRASDCRSRRAHRPRLPHGITLHDGRYPAMLLCNAILGGGEQNRLYTVIRGEQSLCYEAGSWYDGHKGILCAEAGCDFADLPAVEAAILQQVGALAAGDFSQQELDTARAGLLSDLRAMHDSPGRLDEFLTGRAAENLPQDPDALAAALRRVTKEDVRQAAAAVTPDTVCTLEEDA
ncbi:MAG: M16 family metallopeptidase [Oscillospiraceae bacterium]